MSGASLHNLKPGDVFAERYEITELLARSLYGGSFKARDRKLRAAVFLKVLLIEGNNDLARYSRYISEISKAPAGPEFDNFLLPYEQGEYAGSAYFVSPFVENADSLSRMLLRHGAMSPSLALAVISRLIEMQQRLHERKIVHADIKPSNILVSTQDIREIYIIDFGMAEVDTARNELILAATNRYLHPLIRYGTLPPPSDAVTPGDEDETPKSTVARRLPTSTPVPQPGPYLDLYATGIVAFEMLTGGARAPYPLLRADFIAALQQHNPSLRETSTEALNLLHAVVARLVSVRPVEADGLEAKVMRLIAQARAVFGEDPQEAAAYLARQAPPQPARESRSERAPTIVAAIGRLAKLSEEIDAATQVARRPRQLPAGEVVAPITVEPAAADYGTDDPFIEIRQIFEDAGRRARHAWKISIAMIIAAFALTVLMICLAVVFSLIAGKAIWAVVFGGVGASTVLTTLLWRPFDRLMRANILLQQLGVLHIQTAVAYRDSRTAQEKIKVLSDVSKRLTAVFVTHAKPEPSR